MDDVQWHKVILFNSVYTLSSSENRQAYCFLSFPLLLFFFVVVDPVMTTPEKRSSPFLLEAVSDRFEVLLQRYHVFRREIPSRFGEWLTRAMSSQKKGFNPLESVCAEMFPDLKHGDSNGGDWLMPVSCVALKHCTKRFKGVELSACGGAVRVSESATCEPSAEPEDGRDTPSVQFLAARNAALEVRVAELERELRGSGVAETRPARRKRCGQTLQPLPDTMEHTLAYLSERRAEALDAYLALNRAGSTRRTDERLAEANAEIARLRLEVESLRRRQSVLREEARPQSTVILPKRALSMAGFWNLLPNDLLSITPALIEAVEQRGGTVIRREGMHVCFSSADAALVIDAAVDVMGRLLPHYCRRTDNDAVIQS